MPLFNHVHAQKQDFVPVSAKEKKQLRAAVEAAPDNMEAHKAYLAAFRSGDDARSSYESLMKKYPQSASIPKALADKYGHYSPKTAGYLLQAAALQPGDVAVWKDLALDASMRGDDAKKREYITKALAADTGNVQLQYELANLMQEEDEAAWKQQMLRLAEKYPSDESTLHALHIMGLGIRNEEEKIAIWEKLYNLSFPAEIKQFAMSRLADAYIRTGRYDKAIVLSESFKTIAAERMRFPMRLKLAIELAAADIKMKDGNFAAAKAILMPMDMHGKFNLNIGTRVAIAKATALKASGEMQAAYDSLIAFQAKTPFPDVKDSLALYGKSLGKNETRVKAELRAIIARNSRPALPFEVDSYPAGKKVKLSDYKGKVLLLSFWYPGCGPCRGEMPHIEAGIKDISKDQLAYAGVNILREQDDFVLPFMKGTKYSFTPLGATEAIVKDYKIRVAPTNLLIDQDGNIAYYGFMIDADSEVMLKLMIQSLL
ncbi:hypothetical protein CCY01nite_39220 [Chitinophaga cymbidii]|uniref:Thioredoxin domain-containing protein n=2 Tax=Chitinophaga cymbidii TaxID=1096750 RepID=A0A512RPP1_9BACT|nr:hypothetical protein CCY01nite_39220 [Chitinophaga cymbidii]